MTLNHNDVDDGWGDALDGSYDTAFAGSDSEQGCGMNTDAFVEGMSSYMNKRAPRFTGH